MIRGLGGGEREEVKESERNCNRWNCKWDKEISMEKVMNFWYTKIYMGSVLEC